MALTRKNVMVDAEKVRRLAKILKVSESEAIRNAVDGLLHRYEFERAAERLRRSGGPDDVFGRMPSGRTKPKANKRAA